jgi:hypothetical protein
MASRVLVDHLVSALDLAFERAPDAGATDGWHSLLANLKEVTGEQWRAAPQGGTRTIFAIAAHAGFAKRMYADYGFGEGTLPMAEGLFRAPESGDPVAALTEWLREGHALLREGLARCSDSDLAELRRTHWGEEKSRLWFATTVAEHDLYHAGEINHIRAVLQGNDAWPWEVAEQ